MKLFHQRLLALFLIFCLPAQALAAALTECEQHASDSNTSHVAVTQSATHYSSKQHQSVADIADCHGTSHKPESTADSSTVSLIGELGSSLCFHCSGACQNIKPLGLIAKSEQHQNLNRGAFLRFTQATETGIHTTPARPPCKFILS